MTHILFTVLLWLSLGALSYTACINKEYLEDILPGISADLKKEDPRLSDALIRELVFSKLFLIMWLLFFPVMLPVAGIYVLYNYLKGPRNETR